MTELRLHWRELSPSPLNRQVRGEIGEAELGELAWSIVHRGVVQPLTVIRRNGGYQILMGERRWRAAKLLGEAAPPLPCIVREDELSELDQLVLMGIENLQRSDLTPVAEAKYYRSLLERGLDEKEIAQQVGVKLWRIQNRLALLELPKAAQREIDAGRLPLKFAEITRGLPDAAKAELARKGSGRGYKEITVLAETLKKRLAGVSSKTERRSRKEELETLRGLAAQLCTVIAGDARELERLGQALEEHGDDRAVEALNRAFKIKKALERVTNGR